MTKENNLVKCPICGWVHMSVPLAQALKWAEEQNNYCAERGSTSRLDIAVGVGIVVV